MSEYKYPIPSKVSDELFVQWSSEPIRSVVVFGHGALAERQKPIYEHWLKEKVEVHCADTDPSKLEDCVKLKIALMRYIPMFCQVMRIVWQGG